MNIEKYATWQETYIYRLIERQIPDEIVYDILREVVADFIYSTTKEEHNRAYSRAYHWAKKFHVKVADLVVWFTM